MTVLINGKNNIRNGVYYILSIAIFSFGAWLRMEWLSFLIADDEYDYRLFTKLVEGI